jgi:glycosyltransferase involved in cell wall biosynthesis
MNYYKLFNVSVLPSTSDGFGLVLVEAMGSGVPVVATKSTGIIDVLDNQKNGLWFEDNNIEELSKKLEMAIYNKQLRTELISNGLKAAHDRFTIHKTIFFYERFFQEIIEGNSCWADTVLIS